MQSAPLAVPPRPLFRWQLGLLARSLPRRFIPAGLRDLSPSGADDGLPQPIGEADPCQLGGLPDQCVMLWQ
jgi:hypothetical protein